MRYSARSTDRRAGFTLLEVIIAVSIFSVVLIVALSQMNESGEAVRLATLQADLRKSGERVLAQIVKDVRSTQTVYSGANSGALEMARVAGFDTTNRLNILEGNSAGTSANVVGNSTIIYKYSQPTGDNSSFGGDKNLGCLVFERGSKSSLVANAPPLTTRLCQELAKIGDTDWPYPSAGPVNGFEISRVDNVALPGLLTANTAFANYNSQAAPVTLRIKLVLKRAAGFSQNTPTNVKKQFVWTTLDTQVQLRTDESY
jgi:prepilin-type N-terminal cleavage/methylation domain-containing protein